MAVMDSTGMLGIVASMVFIARLTPQPLRLARSGVADGVSPLSALNGLIAAVSWLVYGLLVDDPVVWIVSLVAVLPGVWTVAMLRRETTWRDLLTAGAWAGSVVTAALAGYLAAALAVGVLVTQGPQVWRACRERDLSGLSPATWGLSILDAAAWGAYGVAADDAALIGYAVVLSSSAVVVLTRIRWTRSQARSDGAKRRTTSSAMT